MKWAGVRRVRSTPGLDTSRVYRPGIGSSSSSTADTARLASVSASRSTPPARSTVTSSTPDAQLHVHQFEVGGGYHRFEHGKQFDVHVRCLLPVSAIDGLT